MHNVHTGNVIIDGNYPSTPTEWALTVTITVLIVLMLMVGILNAAMDCDRDHPENCIVVQHMWEAGL